MAIDPSPTKYFTMEQFAVYTFWQLVASMGGIGVLMIGFSTWIANLLAKNILLKHTEKSNIVLERVKTELQKEVDGKLEELRVRSQNQVDFVLRKREVYERLAKSLRIFLLGGNNTDEDKKDFLAAYDLAYLWASDPLVVALGELLDILLIHSQFPDTKNQVKMKRLYEKALLEMRKDSGFPETSLPADSYKFIAIIN